MTDSELIKGCLAHQRVAQKALVAQYGALLMTVCRRYIKDHHFCQDACQDALVRIFQNLEKFDSSKGSLKNWMYTVTVNCCLHFLRKKKIKVEELNVISEPIIEKSIALENLIAEDLLKLLDHLTEMQRSIFNLIEIEGYDHGTASEMLGINASTCRSHLYRARIVLTKKVNQLNLKSKCI